MSNSFFSQKKYAEEDLQMLIKNQIEESINLDYKSARAIDNSPKKNKEIAKHISAFANSDGGIIIYGIEENDHRPQSLSFVDGNQFTKEWLENIIDSHIHQKIHDLIIYPIRVKGDVEKTVYLVKIPPSDNVPHQCSDKVYYRRYNFKSVPMEEYEIRLLYNRVSNSEMDFKSIWSKHIEEYEDSEGNKKIKREINIHVKNISSSLEKHCKVVAKFKDVHDIGFSINYDKTKVSQKYSIEDRFHISAFNESPVFPGEEVAILSFGIEIYKSKLEEFNKRATISLMLFDSAMTKSYVCKMDQLIDEEKYISLLIPE
jgi:hypothetical protein